MADNQRQMIMKNVILTHKELQFQIFNAVTQGLKAGLELPKNLYVIEVTDPDVVGWQLVFADSIDSAYSRNVDTLTKHMVNRGAFQMNDIRIGVTVQYLRIEAEKFVAKVQEYIKGVPQIVDGSANL